MTRHYEFDAVQRIWASPNAKTLTYSDGDQTEEYLFSVIANAKDVSANSLEMVSAIKDWPSEYHLSPVRHNLLRPFLFQPTDRILELGCGCGAMTRYLGESGATVIAVEGSRRRAMITAERCRDLPNVSVYCDNLVDFQVDAPCDVVMLIGVLEYAPLYVAGSNPAGSVLETASRHLTSGGELMLAIENQFGLKYLSGCAEDHTNIPFFGVYDLYGSSTPVTFGKNELTSKLHSAGFVHTEFYYPFPDYKVPEVLLTEAALDQPDFRPADLLYRTPSRDYGNVPWRAFYENLAWRGVARNELLGDLSNSFFILASASSKNVRNRWLAHVFSGNRLPIFATKTVFRKSDDGIVVDKTLLHPSSYIFQQTRFRHHPSPRSKYIIGELYAIELQKIMARAGSVDEIALWVSTWLEHLFQRADSTNQRVLPGDCVDVIPANLIRTTTGALVEIDCEWSAIGLIPLNWVLIRGLVNAFVASPLSPVLSKLSYRDAIERVLSCLSYTLSDRDFDEAIALEDELQRLVNGADWNGPLFGDVLSRPELAFTGVPSFGALLASKQSEIDRVKATFSWQITKPLRFVWNAMSRLLTPNAQRK